MVSYQISPQKFQFTVNVSSSTELLGKCADSLKSLIWMWEERSTDGICCVTQKSSHSVKLSPCRIGMLKKTTHSLEFASAWGFNSVNELNDSVPTHQPFLFRLPFFLRPQPIQTYGKLSIPQSRPLFVSVFPLQWADWTKARLSN